MVKQGVVEDSHVSVVKTHRPERRGLRQFSAFRVLSTRTGITSEHIVPFVLNDYHLHSDTFWKNKFNMYCNTMHKNPLIVVLENHCLNIIDCYLLINSQQQNNTNTETIVNKGDEL